jgi:energy-coupling factor transport system permease protein
MHPGAWIAWATCAGLVAFTTTNPFYLALVVAASWLVYTAQRARGEGARSFRVFLLFGLVAMAIRTVLVLFGTVDASSVVYAALEGMRLAVILVVFGTFNAVSDPSAVLRLAPRRFHEPALAAALALSIAPRTIAAAGRVREAQELRGIRVARWKSLPALAVPVLETGMEQALTLAESMDARGHGRGRRSRYRPERFSAGALVMMGCAAVSAGAFLVTAFGGGGDLRPSTAPLAWPEVSWTLIGAAVLLAVPALLRPRERP